MDRLPAFRTVTLIATREAANRGRDGGHPWRLGGDRLSSAEIELLTGENLLVIDEASQCRIVLRPGLPSTRGLAAVTHRWYDGDRSMWINGRAEYVAALDDVFFARRDVGPGIELTVEATLCP
jgi:hypothetical protein